MRTHTSEFKEELKVFGRQINGKITYYPSYNLASESDDNILSEADLQIISEQANYDDPIEISEEDIFSISIIKNGDLLQSLMKEFDFETKEEFNIGSVVNPQFGLLVDEDYEYLDYGNYIINSKEFNMDTETWSYVCYDKMLFSMIKYKGLTNIEYPITIKQFINKLCEKIGLEFEDSNFVNQNQLIYEDLYKDRDVTFRDIFDEISKIVAGNLLINDDDKLEIGYPKKTIAKNLLNIQEIVKGRIDNGNIGYQNGTTDLILNQDSFTFTTNANWRGVATNYIEVEPLTFYIVSYTSSSIGKMFDCYDSNKNWLGRVNATSYDDNWLKYKTLENTKYIRFSWQLGQSGTITVSYPQIEKGEQVTNYERFGEAINEDYLKDTNVRMAEKIGVINSVAILDSDNNIEYVQEDTASIKANEMTRVTITDNLLALNGDTNTIALNILNKLNGLYYYANDLQTTGVCYYDFLDMFNVEARGNTYQCLLLNNEITITQGIEEHIFTEKFEEAETSSNEYTTSIMTNKQIQFNINQQEGRIESKVEKDGVISAINQSAEEIQINASKLSFEGAVIDMTADDIKIQGENLEINSDGMITLIDNSASNSLDKEELHSAYIIKSSDSVQRGVRHESLDFVNKIVGNGHRTEVEMNWDDGEYTGGGISGIMEAVYSQPRISLYGQSLDFDITGTGDYESLDISLTGGISYSGVSDGVAYTPFMITTAGNIICSGTITSSRGVCQGSREEIKKNFEKLTNAKEILNNVDIYKYNYKKDDENVKKSIGFVIGDNFNYSQEITSQNNDGVNLYSMVSVLWQVVKEQQEEINKLKEVINNGKY